MVFTHVTTPTVPFRSNFQWVACSQKPSFPQVFPEGGLHYGRERGWSFLRSQIVVRGLGQVIGECHGGSFHNLSIAPSGEDGECCHIGEVGEAVLLEFASGSNPGTLMPVLPYLLSLGSPDEIPPRNSGFGNGHAFQSFARHGRKFI